MTDDLTTIWHRRRDTGRHEALDTEHHPNTAYSVGRDDRQPKERQWFLESRPLGWTDPEQRRTGFHSLKVAQYAAMHTRCDRCGRAMPFGSLALDKAGGSMTTWRCRDQGPCDAKAAERDAEATAMDLEAARRPYTEIIIRDGRYGPELVFENSHTSPVTGAINGHATVVPCTEDDLARLERRIIQRRQAQATELLERHQAG